MGLTQTTEQERAEFEEQFKHLDLTQEPDAWGKPRYKHDAISLAWEAWQAARRAQVAPVPDLTSAVVNDACWKFVEAMPHRLPGPIFNDLKPALYEALRLYHDAMLAAAPQPPEAAQLDDINVVDMPQAIDLKEAAPVQLPQPWGHCVAGQVFVSRELPAHIKPLVESGEFLDIKLYTEQQVRRLLAAHGIGKDKA